MTPVGGLTSIKFENCKLQEFAIPARGVTSIKFSIRKSRRDVEIRQQYYIVVLIKGYKYKMGAYLECGTS